MTDDDHRRLATLLQDLRGAVIVSGYESPLYSELFATWDKVTFAARAHGNKPRTEVLWMRNVPSRLLL